jgi:transcriptional regulator with XRE-family HTH domain
MPTDADRAGTPAGVFGAGLRFYRTRAGLSQKDLAARATVSLDDLDDQVAARPWSTWRRQRRARSRTAPRR